MCITKNTFLKYTYNFYIYYIILLKQSLELQVNLIATLMTRRGAICKIRMLHGSFRTNSLIRTANKQFLQ